MILNKYTDRFFHFTFCLNYFFNLKNILGRWHFWFLLSDRTY
jgi:hypothetical protein